MLGHNKRLQRKLKEHGGNRAWATILESKKGSTTTGGVNVVPGQAGSITMRREFRLRVEPEGEPPFEAAVKQAFNDSHGWQIPEEGWSVTVIYDPNDHSKVVMDVDAMPVGPGVDRDEAVARHERAMERQKIREMAPGDSGRRAEQVRAVALDATLSPEEKRAKIIELSASMGAAPKTMFVGGQVVQAGDAAGPAAAVDALAKLADLRDRGVLTDAEFEAQKAKLLGSS
jgi:hypothetical protein